MLLDCYDRYSLFKMPHIVATGRLAMEAVGVMGLNFTPQNSTISIRDDNAPSSGIFSTSRKLSGKRKYSHMARAMNIGREAMPLIANFDIYLRGSKPSPFNQSSPDNAQGVKVGLIKRNLAVEFSLRDDYQDTRPHSRINVLFCRLREK